MPILLKSLGREGILEKLYSYKSELNSYKSDLNYYKSDLYSLGIRINIIYNA